MWLIREEIRREKVGSVLDYSREQIRLVENGLY